MKLKILHLFPDLLDQYFDSGNIVCMRRRLEWRGIGCEVISHTVADLKLNLSDADIVLLGGGADKEQFYVCDSLLKQKSELKSYVEDGGALLAICGGYQLLGNYYRIENEMIQGLEILDIYTEAGNERLIGDVILEVDFLDESPEMIVGFENHSGRTSIGKHAPFGKVLYGNGNSDNCGFDGVLYKNVIGTYLHGPLLPKNPGLCDFILSNALERRYGEYKKLEPLDDRAEHVAKEFIVNRYLNAKKKWKK